MSTEAEILRIAENGRQAISVYHKKEEPRARNVLIPFARFAQEAESQGEVICFLRSGDRGLSGWRRLAVWTGSSRAGPLPLF